MDIEILSSLEKPDLFEKFRRQVYKDFEMAGVSSFTPKIDSTNLEEIQQAFYQSILKLDVGNALKNLIYRIDISENQIKKASLEYPKEALQFILAELMIKRILQKVILKELHS